MQTLNAASSRLTSLKGKGAQPLARIHASSVARTARRVERLGRSLETYAAIRPSSRVPTDLGRIARDVAEELAQPHSWLTESMEIDPLPVVSFDETHARLLFHEIFRNVVDHTPIDTRVRITAKWNAGPVHEIRIADDGPGIPSDLGERALLPFTLAREPREGGGPGLGLAICQRILRAHGGELGLEASPGSETCVVLRIPTGDEQTPGGHAFES